MSPRDFKRTRARTVAGAFVALALSTTTTATAAGAFAAEGSGGIGSGGTAEGETPAPEGETPGPVMGAGDGVFPLRAKHTYGDGLGAGRGHQGQDVLAKCGKRIVAAQPGRVQTSEYHGSAGNYVVVDGKGALEDLVYMHLQSRSPLRKGQRVAAGAVLGRVGDTGSASTCHLHFEIWSNPGYYEGGEPVDPTPSLKNWDRSS